MNNPLVLFEELPELKTVLAKAEKLIKPKKVWLFGSRARGDARSKSDIDLAFDFEASQVNWIQFKLWVSEDLQSLLSYDLVNINEINLNFRNQILSEGVLLYGES